MNQLYALICLLLVTAASSATGKNLRIKSGAKAVKVKCARQAHAQEKLSFSCRTESGPATLEIAILVGKEKEPHIKKIKVEKTPIYKNVILNLDTDFQLGDAYWNIKEISFAAKNADIAIRNVRIASLAALSGHAKFVVVPAQKKKTAQVPADVVRVFFDLDNLDCSKIYPIKRHSRAPVESLPDPIPYQGFRDRILEGCEAVICRVDSPDKADVIVYSRADGKVADGVVEAVKKGKRLILYGGLENRKISQLAPLELTLRKYRNFPVRGKIKRVIPEHWLFAGTTAASADYGQYFDSKLRHGKVIAAFEDGNPAIVENGNILQFAFGVGPALLENGPWYDAGLLRAIIGNSPEKAARLDSIGKKLLSKRHNAERTVVSSVIGNDDPRYNVGVSTDNFGRFGWEVNEALLCSQLGSDLSISNGDQYFRFELTNNRKTRSIKGWHGRVVSGNVKLNSTNDPTRLWSGEGTVEYVSEMNFDPAWKGKSLSFEVDKGIDDIDKVSINGVLIGNTGVDTPNYWNTPRRYPIPANAIRWGKKNRIVVHNMNLRGDAGFKSRPVIRIGEETTGSLPELSVPTVNWVTKKYRVKNGKTIDDVMISLLSPFTQFRFGRDRVSMTVEERTVQYGAYSTSRGIRVKPLSPDFYDRKRDGKWNAPWLLLFRKNWRAGRPILLVFEKQPDSIKAKLDNHYVTGLDFETTGGLGTVAAGWPWGVTPVRSDKWVRKLPAIAIAKIKQSLDLALHFPVACDEIFRIDEPNKRIEVVNKYHYRPVQTAWNTPTQPFVCLPPLIALAVREKLSASATEPLTDFGVNTTHGPLLGKHNASIIRYTLPLPEERNLLPVNVKTDPELHHLINKGAGYGWNWSWSFCPERALSPEFPNGIKRNPRNPNINSFGWFLGLGDALQGFCFFNKENRTRLGARIGKRFLAPFELYQYKAFARFREEPFSKIRYPVLFSSARMIKTNFAPGFGSSFVFGDCNEACTFMVWVAQQLGDQHGYTGFIRANWSALREGMRFSWCINDWSYLSGSHSGSGRGAWIDMLNCEYPGMIAFTRLARIAGDKELVKQGLYRAAKRAIPTLVRFRAFDYLRKSRPDIPIGENEMFVVTGFAENEIKFLRTPLSVKNHVFRNGCYFVEFSRGSPGSILDLYVKNIQPEMQNYLTRYAMPVLTKGGKIHYSYTGLKVPLFFDKTSYPYRTWADQTYANNEKFFKRDVSGTRLGACFGPILWRKHGKISIAESSGITLASADFDPSSHQLKLKLRAQPQATLSLAAGLPVESAFLNGRKIDFKGNSDGIIRLPVDVGNCEYTINFKKKESK